MSASGTYQTQDNTEPFRGVQPAKPPIKPKPIIAPRPKDILCPNPKSEIKNALLSPTLSPCSPNSEIPSAFKISQLTGPQPYGTRRTSLKRWSSSVGDDGNQELNILSPIENTVSDVLTKVTTQPPSSSVKSLQTGSVWKGKSPFILTTRGWGEQRWSQEKETQDCEPASKKHSSILTSKHMHLKPEEAASVEENVMVQNPISSPQKSSTIFEDVISSPFENTVSEKTLHTPNVPVSDFKNEPLPSTSMTEMPKTSGRDSPVGQLHSSDQVTLENKNTEYDQVKDVACEHPSQMPDMTSELYVDSINAAYRQHSQNQDIASEQPSKIYCTNPTFNQKEYLTTKTKDLKSPVQQTLARAGEDAGERSRNVPKQLEAAISESVELATQDSCRDHACDEHDVAGNLENFTTNEQEGQNNNEKNDVMKTPDSAVTVPDDMMYRESHLEDKTSLAPTESNLKKEKKHESPAADNNNVSISGHEEMKITHKIEGDSYSSTDINTDRPDNILDETQKSLDKTQADVKMQTGDYIPHRILEASHKQTDFPSESRSTDGTINLPSHDSVKPSMHLDNSGTVFQSELPEHASIKTAPHLNIENSNLLPEEIYTEEKQSHIKSEDPKQIQDNYTETNVIYTQPEVPTEEFNELGNNKSKEWHRNIQLEKQYNTGNEVMKQQSTYCVPEEPFHRDKQSDSLNDRYKQSEEPINTSRDLENIPISHHSLQTEEPISESEQFDESSKHYVHAEKPIDIYEPSESVPQYASKEEIYKNEHLGNNNQQLVDPLYQDDQTGEPIHHSEDQTQRYELLENSETEQPCNKSCDVYKYYAEPDEPIRRSKELEHSYEGTWEGPEEPLKNQEHSDVPVCEQKQLNESDYKPAQLEEQAVSSTPLETYQADKGLDYLHMFHSEEAQHKNDFKEPHQSSYMTMENEHTVTESRSQHITSIETDSPKNIPVEQHYITVPLSGGDYMQKYLEQPQSYSNELNDKDVKDDPVHKKTLSEEQSRCPVDEEEPQHCYTEESEHVDPLEHPRHTGIKLAEVTEMHIETDGNMSEEAPDIQDEKDNVHLGNNIDKHSESEEEYDKDITSVESKLQSHTNDEIPQDSEQINSQEDSPVETNFDFLEGTAVLDSSYMRSRASLGKKRCRKTPVPGACISQEEDTEYWMFRDSTEQKCCLEKDSEDEEKEQISSDVSPDVTPDNSPSEGKSHAKKGGIFAGIISPSILKGRLKGRNKSTEVETTKSDSEEVKSPGKEKADSPSHSLNWLHALKKKKKKQK